MGYSKELYDRVLKILRERRVSAELQAKERAAAFYAMEPRAGALEREIASTAAKAAKAILQGADAVEKMKAQRDRNLTLQKERAALLRKEGLPETYLQPDYHCKLCKDTGFLDGKMCGCLKRLLREEAYRELNALTPLTLSSFENFSLDFYPDTPTADGKPSARKQMEHNLQICKDYARDFSEESPSLLMQGGTGLGKTHLSLAIARAVIDKGFGVVYGSAQNLAINLDKERFGSDGSETMQHLLSCDLLILDDLGTEFSTSYISAAIYNIINTRLLSQKPTIINTNLSTPELQERYTERFVSRIIGAYLFLAFIGQDIRQEKRRRKVGRSYS